MYRYCHHHCDRDTAYVIRPGAVSVAVPWLVLAAPVLLLLRTLVRVVVTCWQRAWEA